MHMHSDYVNKGLSVRVLQDITRNVAQTGAKAWANIEIEKHKLRELFKHCGYTEVEERVWLEFTPNHTSILVETKEE